MAIRISSKFLARLALIAGTSVLAACAAKAPPPPPPPPPPPVVVIPPKPRPPVGAPENLVVPPLDAIGARMTVNHGISPAQAVWNLRSAYNVAALNCLKPQHAAILTGYRAFLKSHARTLTRTNRTVDSEFRAKHGAGFIRPREAYMTQVYNYYALPPTQPAFCDAALAMSIEAQGVKSADLPAFAARAVVTLDQVFEGFFRDYDRYLGELAAWEAKYAPRPAPALVVPVPASAQPSAPAGQAPMGPPSR